LDAARLSYEYLKKNPGNKGFRQGDFKTGGYPTSDPDDRLWAAAEMWETTGEEQYLKDFETKASVPLDTRKGFNDGVGAGPSKGKVDIEWDWGNVRNLGMFTYAISERQGRDTELVETIRKDIIKAADLIVANAEKDVYNRPLAGTYYWGCNGGVARQALNLQVANMISPKTEYVETVSDIIGHLFGRNYYGRSYVTGLGHKPPVNPHDRRSGGDEIKEPWPGYIVGGSNPGATAWQDVEGDYRTNEIAINWQAGLVYALAGFVNSQP
jgi:endoglucanase